MSNGMGGWNSVVRVTAPVPPNLSAFAKDGKLFFQTDGPAEVLVTVDNMLGASRGARRRHHLAGRALWI